MDIATLTTFFMWCTIFNVGLLSFWSIIFIFAPDFVFKKHSKWFPMSRETYNVASYSFLGIFKIFLIIFNIVPYLALLMIGSASQ